MENALSARRIAPGRLKFIIGGLLIIAAIIYLIVTSTQSNSQYFMTIGELQSKSSSLVGQDVRISGAVIGDTIKYDPQSMTLSFSVANVPGDNRTIDAQGGLAACCTRPCSIPSGRACRSSTRAGGRICCKTRPRPL